MQPHQHSRLQYHHPNSPLFASLTPPQSYNVPQEHHELSRHPQAHPHHPTHPSFNPAYAAPVHPNAYGCQGPDVDRLRRLHLHNPADYQGYNQGFLEPPLSQSPHFNPSQSLASASAPSTRAPPILARFADPAAPSVVPAASAQPISAPSPAASTPVVSATPPVSSDVPYVAGKFASQKYEHDHGDQPPSMKNRISANEVLLEWQEVPRRMGELKLQGRNKNRFVQPVINILKSHRMAEREPKNIVKRLEDTWAEAKAQKTAFENKSTGWGQDVNDELSFDERVKATWPLYHRFKDVLYDAAGSEPMGRHDSSAANPDDRAEMMASLLPATGSTRTPITAMDVFGDIDEADLELPAASGDELGGHEGSAENEEADRREEEEAMGAGTSKRQQEVEQRRAARQAGEPSRFDTDSITTSTTSDSAGIPKTPSAPIKKNTQAAPMSTASSDVPDSESRKAGKGKRKARETVEDTMLELHEKEQASAKAADAKMEEHIVKRLKIEADRLDMEKARIEEENKRYLVQDGRTTEREAREAERHKVEMSKHEDDLFFSRYGRFEKEVESRKRSPEKAGRFIWGEEWPDVERQSPLALVPPVQLIH